MKEILCRAKRIDNREWIQGSLINLLKVNYFICTGELRSETIKLGIPVPEMYKVDEETICPYIGVKDKNSNMIFKDDICNYFNPEDGDGIGIIRDGYVRWIGGTIAKKESITPLFYLQCGQEWEVLGNVFDNEELLEKYR